MSKVLFIGDLHLDHGNVHKFRKEFVSDTHHHEHVMEKVLMTVNKKDLLYLMGDSAFSRSAIELLKEIKGRVILVKGNHDYPNSRYFLDVVEEVHGITKYKRAWLTHCPIHPAELWGKFNIHGHVHQNTILTDTGEIDARYVNVCAENIDYTPISFADIVYWREQKMKGADIHLQDHRHFGYRGVNINHTL